MADGNRIFNVLVLLTFALMVVIILLSAHMRLSGAGLGCPDWPACYGHTLAGFTPPRPDWINTTHRIAASTMGFAALVITSLAWRRRRVAPGDLLPALALLGLTGFLAVLGKWTHDAHVPAVALGNLLGGLGMLALLWRLHLGYTPQHATSPRLRVWVPLGLGLLAAQIALGGMVSASFAALSCAGSSGCEGWMQLVTLADFNPFQTLKVPEGGVFVAHKMQQTLHMTHRLFALLVFCYLSWMGVRLYRENMRKSGILLIAALMLQIALGIVAVTSSLPLFLVLLHNAMAAFLLLVLVTLNFRLRSRESD